MGSFSELSIGDLLRAAGRYRPVAVSVLAILVALALLPKPDRPPGLASTGLTGAGISTPSASGSSSSVAAGAGGDAVDASTGGSVVTTPVPDGAVTFSPGSSFSTPTSFAPAGGSSGGSSSSAADPSADIGPVTSGTSTVDTTGDAPAPKPLQVVGKLWAGRTGGTPVAKEGVPEGTLPVAFRVTDDRISFVKLAGDGTSLGFAPEASGTYERSGPPKIQACKATSEWSDAEAVPLTEAPDYDPNRCVQGTTSAGGVWLFDLSSFPDRTDAFGFALVPGDGAGLEWQVAFRL